MTALVLLAGCGARSTDDWLQQLKDPDVVKRRQAIRELGGRTEEAGRVVPALVEALHDGSEYVRRDAAATLGKFGPDAVAAVPALKGALKDNDQIVRKAAEAAIRKITAQATGRGQG
jgi:HEAT repeat protein